jgi:GntR family transcriptional repressor for pyruvate dehydrogenase complex
LKVASSSSRPAYEALAEDLRRQILDGHLHPGDQLPVEPELSAKYGLSRSTVREALRVLSSEHLVETTRGVSGGTFVVHPNATQIGRSLEVGLGLLAASAEFTVEQLIEVRELIEVPAAEFAAARASDAQLAALETTLFDPERSDPTQIADCNQRFHTLLIEAAANPLLEVLAAPLFRVLTTRFIRDDAPAPFWDEVVSDHREILTALRARDGVRAAALTRAHLGRLRPTYEAIDRVGRDG